MMDIQQEVNQLVGQEEGLQLEYKAVLPPAKLMARIISSFANAQGGVLVLGVSEFGGRIVVNGLSEDFRANSVTHHAIDMLSPRPSISYDYVNHKGKRLFAIKVEKADQPVSFDGKIYLRNENGHALSSPEPVMFKGKRTKQVADTMAMLDGLQMGVTTAMARFLEHYNSVLNILGDLGAILYPKSEAIPTDIHQGKVLMRILFSSCADNFEIYLSDLLYEIFLAFPDTLKSGQQVSVKEVLDCSDMQEFVLYYANKKLEKLQRGSVKGFISDNAQIKDLGVIDSTAEDRLEKILQIRHLYAHKNGRIDEKFLKSFPGEFQLQEEHLLSLTQIIESFKYLVEIALKIDQAAVAKYHLGTI